jgi:hypothetical protein
MRAELKNFNVECQTFNKWCWAAVGAAIKTFYSPKSPVTQCEIAEDFLRLNCCGNDISQDNDCNQTASFGDLLRSISHLETSIPNSVDPQVVHDRTQDQKPICVFLKIGGQMVGHIVAIKSFYDDIPGEIHLRISDPEIGECMTTFDCLKSGYRGSSKWCNTYFTKG